MKKMLKKMPQQKIKKLSSLLSRSRSIRGISQSELASLANVSTKTIVAIEKGTLKTIGPRAIAKIAKALDQDPLSWLELMGYKNVPPEKLEETTTSFPGKTSSQEFFERLDENSSPESPTLLCLTFLSRVSQINREGLALHLLELIEKESLWVAIIVPYPENISAKLTGSLASHYQTIQIDVKTFVATLASRLGPDKSKRLGLFISNETFTPAPYLSSSLARSNFVKYSNSSFSTLDKDQPYELISWGITPHDGKEVWYSTYPTPRGGNLESALQTLEIWKDYYSPLVSKFDAGGNGWGTGNVGIWKRIVI